MISDIKVVQDKLFRHLYVERKLKNEAFEWENFPDIKILKAMLISQDRFFVATNVFTRISPVSPLFFVKTQCIVGSFEGKHFVNVSPLKLLYFSCKNDAE